MYVKQVDFNAENAAKVLAESLRETGFAVINHHPIDFSKIYSLYAEWEQFFKSDNKFDYTYNKGQQDGYVPMDIAETAKGSSVRDIKEFYQYYYWGQFPKELSDNTHQVYQEMQELAARLLGWIEKETPADVSQKFSEHLSGMIKDSTKTQLRILHYPPLTGDEEVGAIRAAEHEDICLITLLPASTATGLQVKDREGHWHNVPSQRDSIIMNIGDMLQECSGGYYPSTTHRVINPEGEDRTKSRMSLPLFLHPRNEVVLSERYTAESYLHERLVELGVL